MISRQEALNEIGLFVQCGCNTELVSEHDGAEKQAVIGAAKIH